MPSLYDLLPPDVKAAHPPESLDAPAAKVLLDPALVPAGYDPAKASAAGQTLAGLLPHMSQMRAMTNRVRAGQRGELGSAGFPAGPEPTDNFAPPAETGTQRLYRAIHDVPTMTTSGAGVDLPVTIPAGALRAGARVAAGAVQSAPKLLPGYSTRDIVPRGTTAGEHAADVLGQVLGFGATASAAAAIPGVGPAAAAGLAGVSTEGSVKERLIRGATMAATAGAAGKAGGALSRAGLPQGAPAWVAPTATGQLAAQVPPAIGFGAAQPLAESVMHRLTGEKDYPLPSPQDWARGSGEMLVVNLLSHGAGAMAEQLAAAPPDVARHAQEVAKALAPPKGLTPVDAQASARLTEQVGGALKGKRIFLAVPEGGKAAAKVLDVAAFHDPAGGERIHLVVSEPQGGVPVPVTFRSLPELVAAVSPYDRAQGPALPAGEVEQAIAPREATRQAEAATRAAGQRATLEPTRTAREQAETGVAARARIEEIDRSLAGLQKSAPGKGDKDYRRWVARVDRLTAERESLRRAAAVPARPAPEAAPTAESVGGGPEAARTAPEPAQGTATPQSAAEPTAPLEQGRLPGMPAPKISGGAKRSGFDESADIVKGMGVEPEPDRQTDIFKQSAPEPPAGPTSESPESRFAGGEKVRVPNYTNRTNDKRPTVTGEVIGHEVVKGEPHVIVRVPRGGSESTHTLPERVVRKLPTNATREAAAEGRASKAGKLRASIEEKIGRDPAAAQEMILEARERQRRITEQPGVMDTKHPDYAKARRAWMAAEAVANHAQDVLDKIEGSQTSSEEGDASFDPDNLPPGEEEVIHYSQPLGAKAPAAPRSPSGRPPAPATAIPTPKPLATLPPGDALPAAALPKGALTGPAKTTLPEHAARALEALRQVGREVVALVNPISLAPARAVDVLMEKKGGLDRAMFRTERTQEKVRSWWEARTREQVMRWWDDYENGRPMDPRLAEMAKQYRARNDNMFAAIAAYKDGLPYWDNYFPHLWKNPEAAKQFFGARRRPLEGSKSFLKSRIYDDMRAGMDAGLEPVSWNPEEIMQAAEHNARKFVMVQQLREQYKALGFMKLGRPGAKPGDGKIPEDFSRLDGNWARVYLNPNIEVKEYFDQQVMDGLNAAAKAIGATTERKVGIGGTRLGYSQSTPGNAGKVVTRFATPESVLAHEIGHAIDARFPDVRRMVLGQGKTARAEAKALAALRYEGQAPPKSYIQYVQSTPEKMAVMLEALIHAPERFKEVAPHLYDRFRLALALHPETKALLNLRPSLRYGEGVGEVHAGGIVLGGEYWAQEDLARLLNNHMSRDLVNETAIGRGVMASRNTLNGIELGLSGFHATGMTLLSAMSRLSVGLSEVAHGRVSGLGKIATAWKAPWDYVRAGQQFYKGDPSLSQLEQDVFTGGGQMARKAYYQNQVFDAFVRNVRQKRLGPALLQAPIAAIEAPMRLMQSHLIPQMKVGAFRELMASEVQRRGADLRSGKVSREQLAREQWNNIENRMGLLNYDNLFWNQTLKSSVMVMVRAPGWTLGTLREFGGATFIDLPRFAAGLARGKPNFTPRMSFALSMMFTTMALGGVYHFLHTGKRPETLEDYLHPKNGAKDAKGAAVRVDLPTYAKDVGHWAGDPVGAAVGRIKEGRGASALGHGGKLAPEVTMLMDLAENQTYRGPIRNPNDPAYAQAEAVMKYLFGRATPFAVQQFDMLQKGRATTEEKVESFFGITRAPQGKAAPQHGRHARH